MLARLTYFSIFCGEQPPNDSFRSNGEKFFQPINAFGIDFFVKSTCAIFVDNFEKLLKTVHRQIVATFRIELETADPILNGY